MTTNVNTKKNLYLHNKSEILILVIKKKSTHVLLETHLKQSNMKQLKVKDRPKYSKYM